METQLVLEAIVQPQFDISKPHRAFRLREDALGDSLEDAVERYVYRFARFPSCLWVPADLPGPVPDAVGDVKVFQCEQVQGMICADLPKVDVLDHDHPIYSD